MQARDANIGRTRGEAVALGKSRFIGLVEGAGMEEKQHQLEGVEWCIKNEVFLGQGGLIADEMGLGKTLQMLGIIYGHFVRHTLIIVPLALLDQWEIAIKKVLKHAPLVYHGNEKRNINFEMLASAPIVLSTYGEVSMFRGQKKEVHRVKWDRLCFDEGHHLRNARTGQHRGAMALEAPIRWLMTGTPIQNSKKDFYSLCAVMGLDSAYYTKQANLMELVKKYILKRTKKSVGLQLPELTAAQESLMWDNKEEAGLAEQIHSVLGFSQLKPQWNDLTMGLGRHTLPMMVRARQCCILPRLLEAQLAKLKRDGMLDLDEDAAKGLEGVSKLEQVCGKIVDRKDNGRGKLIFCHYRAEIDHISMVLKTAGMNVATFDGRTPHKERNGILTHGWDALILQIQTGCEGLNLQQFSEVYFVSPHWNPAVEDQAVARCHRIGQTCPIDVFRFTMNGFTHIDTESVEPDETYTLDEYSKEKQDHKREIARDVLCG
jgi:SNF2 family DNA or RNA helicase